VPDHLEERCPRIAFCKGNYWVEHDGENVSRIETSRVSKGPRAVKNSQRRHEVSDIAKTESHARPERAKHAG
jgi:hypothetical protein